MDYIVCPHCRLIIAGDATVTPPHAPAMNAGEDPTTCPGVGETAEPFTDTEFLPEETKAAPTLLLVAKPDRTDLYVLPN